MGIRSWLTQMQTPLYRRVVAAEEKIALQDEARHRLRANKLREKAGMPHLGQPTAEERAKTEAVRRAREPGYAKLREQVNDINSRPLKSVDPVADVQRRKSIGT